MQETLYLMITLLDRYLSQVTIKKNEMQLVGLTALLLASKYEDLWQWCPRVRIYVDTPHAFVLTYDFPGYLLSIFLIFCFLFDEGQRFTKHIS